MTFFETSQKMSDLFANKPALHQAVAENQIDVAQYLLKHNADPNIPDEAGNNPLHGCVNVAMNALLLKYRANVNARNRFGHTALSMAIWPYKQPDVVKILLEHKADPNAITCTDHTPLHYATGFSRDPVIVNLLLQSGANPNVSTLYSKTTPLHNAARENNAVSTKLLLEARAQVDTRDGGGFTALLLNVKENQDAEVVNVLLDYGANIHIQSYNGCGVMRVAATCSSLFTLQTLMARRADVFQTDRDGLFPVSWSGHLYIKIYLEKVMWEQRLLTFCQGLHARLGQYSSVRRAFTSELSERYLIWKIGLLLKPSAE